MVLKIFLLCLLFAVGNVFGSCGVCQSNNVACHSETTFSLCQDGIPTDAVVPCPVDRVCTNQTTICVPKIDDSVKASCVTGCGICNSYKKVFSCLSEKTYAFCFGEAEPFYASSANCSDGFVCDLSSRNVCVNDVDSKPSCNGDFVTPTDDPSESTTDLPSTTDNTTSAPRDANTFCSETAVSGTFKAEGDTTCRRYYICVTYKSGFKGYEYICSDFFNSETLLCQKARPDDC